MKKLSTFLIILLVFSGIYLKFFLYLDFSRSCYIKVHPSIIEFSNISMKNALKVLKHASPEDYIDVCENIKTIDPNISCGGFGGGCFYEDEPGTIDISTTYGSLAITAAVIVHETCHAIQSQEDRSLNEQECEIKMADTLSRIVEY
jgi:hypothetical protein